MRHIGFDCLGIAGAELPVAVQKRLQLGLGPQEFLPRPPEHRPGDIEFLISISGKLKIQNAADMMPFPEDIRIVKIAVAKTRVGRVLCGWKKPLEVLKFQRFQYRVRRRVMLLHSETRQYFGTLSGTVELPDGETARIENMRIFCEEKLR